MKVTPCVTLEWNKKGIENLEADNKDEALKCFEKATEIDPDWQELRENLRNVCNIKDVWEIACMWKIRFLEIVGRWRRVLAKFLTCLALFSSMEAVILIAWVLIKAWLKGYLPDIHSWGEWPGNHGPWHFTFFNPDPLVHEFKINLLNSFLLLFLSSFLSLISMLFRFSRTAFGLFVFSFISFIASMKYLYWLID